jgi:putative peptidoglycan lipid II flippase
MPASALLNSLAAGEIAEGQTRLSNLRASLLNLSMILGLAVYYFSGWLPALAWSFTLAFNGLAIWGLWTHQGEGKFDARGLLPSQIFAAAREFLRRLRPLFALPLAEQAQVLVERIAASRIATGAVASLDYARTLSETALLIISQPVGLAYMANYKHGESHHQIEKIVRLILALTLPASAFAFVFAPDIVRLVFYRGAFSETGLLLTGSALRGVSAGLWASTLGWILLRQLNSEGRNGVATGIVVGAYLVNISVNGVVTWLGPSLSTGLLLVGLGETARSLTLLSGTILVLPNRKQILSLAPVAAVPAMAMLCCAWFIETRMSGSLERLAAGTASCALCTLLAGFVLLPELRAWCVARYRNALAGGC